MTVITIVIAATVSVPVMIMIASATIAFPIPLVEASSIVSRPDPVRASIRRASPVSVVPLVVAAYWIPVALYPDVLRSRTSRLYANYTRGRRRTNPNAHGYLGAEYRGSEEQKPNQAGLHKLIFSISQNRPTRQSLYWADYSRPNYSNLPTSTDREWPHSPARPVKCSSSVYSRFQPCNVFSGPWKTFLKGSSAASPGS